MWNWIKHVVGVGAGVVEENIRRWVADLISGVFGFLHTVFHFVGSAWDSMANAAADLWHGIGRLASETYQTFFHLFRHLIPSIVKWASAFLHYLDKFLRDVWHWTVHEFDVVRHWVAALLAATRHWIITDIWNPIWRTLAPAWRWITHEGSTLWHYLTHLPAFIDLIWHYLLVKIEREAWVAGRLLGRFFLSLVVHNIKTFAVLMEDVIDAIL